MAAEPLSRSLAMANIGVQATQAAGWATVGTIGAALLTTVSTVVLARLLSVEAMGLAALSLLIVGFFEIITDLGLGAALIQRNKFDKFYLNTVFWSATLFSIVLYCIIVGTASYTAALVNQPKLIEILPVAGFVLIIGSLKVVPYNLMAKELRFDQRAKAELLSTLVGMCVTIALAVANFSYWSIIIGLIVRSAVLSLVVLLFVNWLPGTATDRKSFTQLLNVGLPLVGSRVLWYGYVKASTLIVSRALSPTALGHFTMAGTIVDIVAGRIGGVVNQVCFPVFAKLQNDPTRRRTAFLRVTTICAVIMTPLLVGMIMVADVAIPLIFTEKWSPMIAVFKVLCILGLATVITSTAPWMMVSLQKQKEVLKFDACCFVLIPFSVFLAIEFGMVAAASAHLVSYVIIMSALHARLFKLINVSIRDYTNALKPAAGMAVVLILTISLLKALLFRIPEQSDLLVLTLCIFVGAVASVSYLFFIHRKTTYELVQIVNSARKVKTIEVRG